MGAVTRCARIAAGRLAAVFRLRNSEPAFWRGLFYYLYEVQKYIVIHVARRHNPASAMAHKAQVMQILDRAFY